MRSGLRFGGAGVLILAAAACLAAPHHPPAVPAAATPAVKKYQDAVAVAEADRTRAVEKARAQLVTDLKAAQKTALQNNDVDGATAIAAMAKQYATGGRGQRRAQPVRRHCVAACRRTNDEAESRRVRDLLEPVDRHLDHGGRPAGRNSS